MAKFVLELRSKDYIPNYIEMVNWVNWGVFDRESHLYHRGIRYMIPKMWSLEDFKSSLRDLPRFRQQMSETQKYVFDYLLSKEKLARGLIY